jgi:hypothetical protein
MPTGAELDILAVVWRLGPSTVRDIHEALGQASTYTTTLKEMQLMTEKGRRVRSEKFRSHVYEAGSPRSRRSSRSPATCWRAPSTAPLTVVNRDAQASPLGPPSK